MLERILDVAREKGKGLKKTEKVCMKKVLKSQLYNFERKVNVSLF